MATKTVTVRLEALVDSYRAKMAQATASTRQFAATQITAAQKNSEGFNTIGLAALGFGAAVAFGLKQAIDAAIEFESSFAGIRKTVDASEAEFTALADGMRQLATVIPINVNELNDLGAAAGQLGISNQNILGFTKVMAELGVATNLTSDQAASALARLANVMQTPQDQFDRMGSTIVALGNNLATTEAEITEFGLRIAGAGQIAGLTEAEVLAIGAAMSSVGVQAEAGGTAIQKVLIGITQAVTMGSDELDDFASAAGMSAEEFSRLWRSDPAAAFTAFVEGLGSSGNDALRILDDLGLTDQRLVRSFLSLANAGDLLRGSIDLGNGAWEDNNALQKEAEQRFNTTASKLTLAQNKINDAAISFGQLMLPAVAAVVGAIGDFALMIGNLPGPIKAVATVLAVAAAAMATLAGASLLVLPRLAATKAAMASLGVQGGLVRGSLTAVAGALNPMALGAIAVVGALTVLSQKAAETRGHVEELTGAIDADTGALGENVRALVAKRLEDEGLLEAASRAGVSLELLTDAVLGNEEAMAAVAEATDHAGEVGITFESELASITREVSEAEAAYQRQKEAIGAAADETAGAVPPTEELTGAVDELGGAAEEAADFAKQLEDALDSLAGAQLAAEDALIGWRNQLRDSFVELHKGTKTLSLNTKAGRDNRQTILDAIDAAIDHGAAIARETGSAKRGAQAVRAHIDSLVDEAVQAGFSRRQIENYIDTLNLTPDDITTLIKLMSAEAEGDLDRYRQDLDDIPRHLVTTLETRRQGGGADGGPIDPWWMTHAGGVIGQAHTARRLHGGGVLRSDEEWVIGQRGERMLSKAENAALSRVFGGQMRSSGELTQGPRVEVRASTELVEGTIRITNWDQGTGHFRAIARTEVDDDAAFGERLARMAR